MPWITLPASVRPASPEGARLTLRSPCHRHDRPERARCGKEEVVPLDRREGLRYLLSRRVWRFVPRLAASSDWNSPFIPKASIADISKVGLHFSIDGQVKQQGTAKDMIFDVPHLINFVSNIMKLEVSLSLPSLDLLC